MTNNAKKIAEEIESVAEGIHRIDVVELPPKIHWGEDFLAWDDAKKIQYLTKFAEAMNHAADTIQKERNELGELAEKKEGMLEQMQSMLDANNRMLQDEVTKMNAYKQEVNAHTAKLNVRIKELENRIEDA